MPEQASIISKSVLTAVSLITAGGPFLADWNETHIHNPKWPGHARFHNGQTMSMGVCLALSTLWKTWFDDRDHLLTASVFASMYYLTGLSAIFYPGARAWDPPEFYNWSFPQLFIFGPLSGIVWITYWLEQRRVNVIKAKTG